MVGAACLGGPDHHQHYEPHEGGEPAQPSHVPERRRGGTLRLELACTLVRTSPAAAKSASGTPEMPTTASTAGSGPLPLKKRVTSCIIRETPIHTTNSVRAEETTTPIMVTVLRVSMVPGGRPGTGCSPSTARS